MSKSKGEEWQDDRRPEEDTPFEEVYESWADGVSETVGREEDDGELEEVLESWEDGMDELLGSSKKRGDNGE